MNACTSAELCAFALITNPNSRVNLGRKGMRATPSGTVGNDTRGTIEIPKPSRTKLISVPRSWTSKRILRDTLCVAYAARIRRSLLYRDMMKPCLESSFIESCKALAAGEELGTIAQSSSWRAARSSDPLIQPQKWVPRPCVFCKGGYDAADSKGFHFDLMRREFGMRSFPSLHLLARVRLHPTDSDDNYSNATVPATGRVLVSLDYDAYSAASPGASWWSIR